MDLESRLSTTHAFYQGHHHCHHISSLAATPRRSHDWPSQDGPAAGTGADYNSLMRRPVQSARAQVAKGSLSLRTHAVHCIIYLPVCLETVADTGFCSSQHAQAAKLTAESSALYYAASGHPWVFTRSSPHAAPTRMLDTLHGRWRIGKHRVTSPSQLCHCLQQL